MTKAASSGVDVRHETGLAREPDEAERGVAPPSVFVGLEAGPVEPVHDDGDVAPGSVSERLRGEDLDDAAVQVRLALVGNRLEGQRQRDSHTDGTGCAQPRVISRADVAQPVAFDAPDGEPDRHLELTESDVTKHVAVEALDRLTVHEPGPALAEPQRCRRQPRPVRIEVVARLHRQQGASDVIDGQSRGQGDTEHGRTRAHAVPDGLDAGLVQGSHDPHDGGERTAAAGRHDRHAAV